MEEDDIEIAHLDDSKQKKEFLEAPSFDEPSELFHNALFCWNTHAQIVLPDFQ